MHIVNFFLFLLYMAYSLVNLMVGGPNTIGFKMDVLAASAIYSFVGLFAMVILFSNKYTLKDKFAVMGTPLSLLFIGLVMGLAVRIQASGVAK